MNHKKMNIGKGCLIRDLLRLNECADVVSVDWTRAVERSDIGH